MALRPNRKNSKVRYIAHKIRDCIDWSLNEMERKSVILAVTVQEMQKKKVTEIELVVITASPAASKTCLAHHISPTRALAETTSSKLNTRIVSKMKIKHRIATMLHNFYLCTLQPHYCDYVSVSEV